MISTASSRRQAGGWRLSSMGAMVCMAVVVLAVGLPSALAARSLDIAGGRRLMSLPSGTFSMRDEDGLCIFLRSRFAERSSLWLAECSVGKDEGSVGFRRKYVRTEGGVKWYLIRSSLSDSLCMAPSDIAEAQDESSDNWAHMVKCDREDNSQLWGSRTEGGRTLVFPYEDEDLCLATDKDWDSEVFLWPCASDRATGLEISAA